MSLRECQCCGYPLDETEQKGHDFTKVCISKRKYDSLIEDSEFLACLDAAGVDNWNGYEYAQELMGEDDEC